MPLTFSPRLRAREVERGRERGEKIHGQMEAERGRDKKKKKKKKEKEEKQKKKHSIQTLNQREER